MKNNSTIIIIVLIASILLTTGVVFYFTQKKDGIKDTIIINDSENIENKINENGSNNLNQQELEKHIGVEKKYLEVEELKIEKIDISDWKIFNNKERGFEVKYPGMLDFIEKDKKNNDPNLSVEDYYYVYFYPNSEDVKKSFLCGTALYVDVHKLPVQNMKLEDLIEAKNEWNEDLLPGYKFDNSKKVLINNREFIFSNKTPDFLSAVIIKSDKYYIIHMGSDIGGSIISEDCKDIYMNFLDSFNFI